MCVCSEQVCAYVQSKCVRMFRASVCVYPALIQAVPLLMLLAYLCVSLLLIGVVVPSCCFVVHGSYSQERYAPDA